MKKKLKRFLIVLICILLILCVFALLTWFKVIPNWFNIEFLYDSGEIISSGPSWWDSDCGYKEYQHNKKISECNDKCVIVSGYSAHAFYERYLDKYGEQPKQNCHKHMTSFGKYMCLDFEYPKDFSYKYTGYTEWIQTVFSSDVEKIKEYNECIRECGPMLEQPQCLQ